MYRQLLTIIQVHDSQVIVVSNHINYELGSILEYSDSYSDSDNVPRPEALDLSL